MNFTAVSKYIIDSDQEIRIFLKMVLDLICNFIIIKGNYVFYMLLFQKMEMMKNIIITKLINIKIVMQKIILFPVFVVMMELYISNLNRKLNNFYQNLMMLFL
jgi:hypothetical protein